MSQNTASKEYLFEGNFIGILTGEGCSHSAVMVRMLHADISAVTEKAVKLTNENGNIWLPKKAIRPVKGRDFFKLAHWFKADKVQSRVLDKMSEVSGISAA